ncbi:ISL3 family transposase [Bifidobacterium psychraerophilum]|uniref:ISL3 family transposase n=2 Tax=Bifidobacterium psychraerophilum TaxID=218140 RepID=UPI0039F645DE
MNNRRYQSPQKPTKQREQKPVHFKAGFQTLCSWMMHSRLEPMKTLARRIRRHWQDILTYFDHRCTNAILEGLNGIIQHIKTRARGFRNMDYFSTMIYLTCGKLDLATVTI